MALNIHTTTVAELLALKSKGAQWFCVAAYAHLGHEKGEVLSWHKTQHGASRAAKGEFRTIEELHYILQDATIDENILASR
jgi:enhancing lycopene biosynthesis protein 2